MRSRASLWSADDQRGIASEAIQQRLQFFVRGPARALANCRQSHPPEGRILHAAPSTDEASARLAIVLVGSAPSPPQQIDQRRPVVKVVVLGVRHDRRLVVETGVVIGTGLL